MLTHARMRLAASSASTVLPAQHAVLVGEREAHQFELVGLDRLRDRFGLARLFGSPEAVALDKILRGGFRLASRH
jgi:hypothetical protein